MSIQCRKGHECGDDRFFCPMCGEFLLPDKYGKDAYGEYQKLIMRIIDDVKHQKHIPVDLDKMSDAFTLKIEKLLTMYGAEEFRLRDVSESSDSSRYGDDAGGPGDFRKRAEAFLDICRKPDFQIAFVGTIKTGKSTLINALLGGNYASVAVTPETAALTKFRRSDQDYVKVEFYDADEWTNFEEALRSAPDSNYAREYNELDAGSERGKWVGHAPIYEELSNSGVKDALKRWSAAASPEHYFVKEIEVGLSTIDKSFPREIVFVDTPGLSDPVPYRSEITQRYIKRADAVFACVESKKLEGGEYKMLEGIFSPRGKGRDGRGKETVYVIATHWDQMNRPVADWEANHEHFAKQLSGPAFFGSSGFLKGLSGEAKKTARENIINTSAYIYNMCRDIYDMEGQELDDAEWDLQTFARKIGLRVSRELSDEDIENIERASNVHAVRERIRYTLVDGYSRLMSERISSDFRSILEDIRTMVDGYKSKRLDVLKSSTGKSIAELKEILDEQTKARNGVRQVQEMMNAQMDELDDMLDEALKKTIENINKKKK